MRLKFTIINLVTQLFSALFLLPSFLYLFLHFPGRKILMRVDDYEPQITNFDISLKSSGDAQFNSITHLYIGKNETMREGFVGCKFIILDN